MASKRWAQALKNVLTNYLSLFLIVASGLMLTPFIINRLGATGYGFWVLANAVFGYLGLLDLGLGTAAARYVSHYRAKADWANLEGHVSTVFIVNCITGCGGLLLAAGVGWYADTLFSLPPAMVHVSRPLFLIGGLNLAVSFPAAVLTGVLLGFSRYDVNNWIGICSIVCNFVCTIVVLDAGCGLVGLMILTVVLTLAGAVVRALVILRTLQVSIRLSAARLCHLKEAGSYSAWVLLLAVASRVVFQTDSIVISIFVSLAAVTSYNVAFKLVDGVSRLVFSAVDVLFPIFSELESQGDLSGQQRIYLEGIKLAVAIGLPFYLVFMLLGRALIRSWVGIGFDDSYPLLLILALAFLIHLPGHVAAILLLSTGKHKMLSLIAAGDAVANLVLSVVLVRWLGLLGVAAGTAISLGISNGIAVPIYACRVLRLPVRRHIGALAAPVLVAGLVGVVGLAVDHIRGGGQHSMWEVCFGIAGVLGLFWSIYYRCAISSEDREFCLTHVRGLVRG